jgi:predicted acylesterase/phospholipase RssA
VTLVTGCAVTPPKERALSSRVPPFAMLADMRDPLNPAEFAPGHDDLKDGLIAMLERKRGHPLRILELSGGGQNGAFGAGFLAGWTASGTRPEFDIVTGVSAGALISTFAFLGTPEDDRVLKDLFTGITQKDVYEVGGIGHLLAGGDSWEITKPLEGLLARHITPEVLARVAAEYDKGRRLFVGTTNLDYGQLWMWDLGGIAKQGGPSMLALYRKVLLASASPPIAFPPVEIEGHLFADGGVRDNVLTAGLVGRASAHIEAAKSEQAHLADIEHRGEVYVIMNNKLERRPRVTQTGLKSIGSRTVDVMMAGEDMSSLLRNFMVTRLHGYEFNLVSIPVDVDVGDNALAFDQEQMKRGYGSGFELGQTPEPWRHTPPFGDEIAPWMIEALEHLQ